MVRSASGRYPTFAAAIVLRTANLDYLQETRGETTEVASDIHFAAVATYSWRHRVSRMMGGAGERMFRLRSQKGPGERKPKQSLEPSPEWDALLELVDSWGGIRRNHAQ